MRNHIANKILSFLLILQILFIEIASKNPQWIEKYYSNGLYPVISGLLRRLLGWIPISVGDLMYGVLLLIILRWIWLLIQTRFYPFVAHLYTFIAFISVVFFFFHLFWGLNYYREPLQKKLHIERLNYTKEELVQTTQKHIDRLNKIQLAITKNDSIPVRVPYKRRKMYKMASLQYRNFYLDSIDFHFKGKSIKSSLISTPLSYMGFSGYLNPFTGESQVNKKMIQTEIPITTCHEMAHQLGFASEGEANYVGYLACTDTDDLYFQFSGELLAVRHLLWSLARTDLALYKRQRARIHRGVLKNMQITHDFWDSYKNPLEPYFKKFYDLFLKANKQTKGIQEYNEMVGYLINNPL